MLSRPAMSSYFIFFWIALFLTVAIAFRWGGKRERQGAAALLIAAVLSLLVWLQGSRYATVSVARVLIDLGLIVGFATIAASTSRWWPRWALAFLIISGLSHLAKLLDANLWRLGYQLMTMMSGLPTLAAVLWGSYQQTRDAKRKCWPASYRTYRFARKKRLRN